MSCVFNTLLRATPPMCRFQEHWYVSRHVKYVTTVVIAEIVYRSACAVENNDCLRQYRLKKDLYTSGGVCSGYTDCLRWIPYARNSFTWKLKLSKLSFINAQVVCRAYCLFLTCAFALICVYWRVSDSGSLAGTNMSPLYPPCAELQKFLWVSPWVVVRDFKLFFCQFLCVRLLCSFCVMWLSPIVSPLSL